MSAKVPPETPSAQAIAKATTEYEVTDPSGHVITLKKPGALAQYRIVEVAGASADIRTYMSMVMPLIFVVAIDQDPVRQPTSKIQLEALISRLGDEGIQTVIQGITDHFGESLDAEVSKETLKK